MKKLVLALMLLPALHLFPQAADSEANDNEPQGKLIQKANDYFDRLWYAKAAEFYEKALEKDMGNHTPTILQKTADSYYFNTDMEKAHGWYAELYKTYGQKMDAETLFRYSHALKGVGKYAESNEILLLSQNKGPGKAQQELYARFLDSIRHAEKAFEVTDLDINTELSEFSPMYLQGDVLFAAARRPQLLGGKTYNWNEEPFLDLYRAHRDTVTQQLSEMEKLPDAINSKYHEAGSTLSPDGKTLYFTRNNYIKKLRNDDQGVNHLKTYRSRLVNGIWSKAEELPFNDDTYSVGHPALSVDGRQLFFVSDMPGSIGMTDIFVVDVMEDGSFSSPRNLGPKINTAHREMFPFVDAHHLYFASDGHLGLGGLDVFQARFLEEGEGFQEPVNMGIPINSNMDDFSLIMEEGKEQGYFASNRRGGKGEDDLYAFSKVIIWATIKGLVTDRKTGLPIAHALVTLRDEQDRPLLETRTDEKGTYVFTEVAPLTPYTLKVKAEGYLEGTLSVTTLQNADTPGDIALDPLETLVMEDKGQKKINIENINFDFDKDNIRPDAAAELDRLVEVMNGYPDMIIKIESHTDSRGSKDYNRDLSDRRAKSTRTYILSQGIAPERIESAIGYGEDRLINHCSDGVPCSKKRTKRTVAPILSS